MIALLIFALITLSECYLQQECIPVGCVPAARRPYAGVCFPGGCLPGPGGLPGAGGSAWSWGRLPGPGGVSPWSGGVCLVPGGGLPGPGGSLPGPGGGGMASQHALRQTPPPCGQTHTCKNITLATTSLRPVKIESNIGP